MENENPTILNNLNPRFLIELKDGKLQNLTKETIFELIRDIKDPEHPYTLEQLQVVNLEDIFISEFTLNDFVKNENNYCSKGLPLKYIKVIFKPTVPHCSMAGIIGLCIIYKITKYTNILLIVELKEDSHSQVYALNKQLSDKDRVMAAFQNEDLRNVIEHCINSE